MTGAALLSLQQAQQVQRPLSEAKQIGAARGTQPEGDAVAGAAQCNQSVQAMPAMQSLQQAE